MIILHICQRVKQPPDDSLQHQNEPGFYEGLVLPEWIAEEKRQHLIVPLLQESRLIGILVLKQEQPIHLTYEDTDLLKIIGRQIAGLLDLQQTSDKLAEGRQFQAYSRLTAFLMHDLKNVAAQQSLVVKNAAKHKRNPKFVDDAFDTIEHSVQRMNRLIAQLAERDRKEKRETLKLASILQAAIARTQDRHPRPVEKTAAGKISICADRDRLFAVFHHVLRNSQDACDETGEISVTVNTANGSAIVEIVDTGVGMDDAFIRERLFRPFESTKGVDGMGIGVYQAREYIRELNGDIKYESERGKGTKVTISLPLVAD